MLLDESTVREAVYGQITSFVSEENAQIIQNAVENLRKSEDDRWATILSIIFLVFTATTLFISIQNALNHIWRIKPRPNAGLKNVLKLVFDRLISFGMVLSLAFILLASLILNAVVASFGTWISGQFPELSYWLLEGISFTLPIIINGLLIAMMLKFLPDARMSWRSVGVGALVTALLFTLGKWLIGYIIGNNDLASAYGAASAILVILLWVFYTAIIFYLGAEVTYVYARRTGEYIRPSSFAIMYEEQRIESREKKREKKRGVKPPKDESPSDTPPGAPPLPG